MPKPAQSRSLWSLDGAKAPPVAAYASYFDGLLSADAKASRIHQEARVFLSALFSGHMHG